MVRVSSKTRLSPPLMYVFRAAHEAKDSKTKVDIRTAAGDRVIASRHIPREIRAAIINFEPRLAAASVHVERDMTVDPVELKIRFIVRADLTCDPVSVPVEFIADIIDGGKILINRR